MAYLSESQLRGYASTLQKSAAARENIISSPSTSAISIFLSHSHKDRDIAFGLVLYLAEFGVKLYVDWNDAEMPRITNRTTAEKIKAKINDHKMFMILATRNGLASKWVPWETGIADQCKGEERILLVPVIGASGSFEGSEYMQLYRHLDRATSGLPGIFKPGETTGVLFEQHIRTLL